MGKNKLKQTKQKPQKQKQTTQTRWLLVEKVKKDSETSRPWQKHSHILRVVLQVREGRIRVNSSREHLQKTLFAIFQHYN